MSEWINVFKSGTFQGSNGIKSECVKKKQSGQPVAATVGFAFTPDRLHE